MTGAAARWRRRALTAGLVLAAAVTAAHLWFTDRVLRSALAADDTTAAPPRIDVAFVRELRPTAPPPRPAVPAPPAPPPARVAAAARAAALPASAAAAAPAGGDESQRVADTAATPAADAASAPVVTEAAAPLQTVAAAASASAPSAATADAGVAAMATPAATADARVAAIATPAATPASSAAAMPFTVGPAVAGAAAAQASVTGAAADTAAPAAAGEAGASASASAPANGDPAADWPPSTRLSYRLTGQYRGPVEGQAQVEWLRRGARYQVRMDVSIGPAFAPLMSRQVASEGEITAAGLSPRRYDEETRALLREPRRMAVQMDGARVRLHDGRELPRPPALQDSASQFVQLTWLFTTQPALLTPGRRIELPLALPRALEPWVYEVRGRETLPTPAGPVETVHVRPLRVAKPGTDLTAEVWVAPTLQNLPVRILIRQDAATFLDLQLDRLPQQAAPGR